ncbi:hypothetical protein [Frankia tisae]|uniref:hypothetical protein n=1 Tax=Frankia tisae TaxID=2950104 RepID=UPI0021C18E5A|nr:hypothetical protein [Frankia tisae]
MTLSECGTHAFLAAEVAPWTTSEKALANRLYQRLRPDELLTADRLFYGFDAWALAAATGPTCQDGARQAMSVNQ